LGLAVDPHCALSGFSAFFEVAFRWRCSLRSARFALRCIVGFATPFKMSHHKNKGVASHNSLHGKPNAAPRREGALGVKMLDAWASTDLSAWKSPFHGLLQIFCAQSKPFASRRFDNEKARALTLA
jgi:hypothetical protein